jgi:hypothetical protein
LDRQRGEPVAERLCLPVAERRERHVDVTVGDVDRRHPAEFGDVARDVARALAVPHDPQRLRPFLFQEARSPVVTSVVRRRRDRDVAHRGIAREQRPCPERRAAQE